MLLNFGARNFFCFREGIEISMELGAKCPENISRGNSVTNLLCVKGANASGKTNVLKIMGFLNNFCCNSFATKPDKDIEISSFFHNNENIDIFCEFTLKDIFYRYELCLTKENIVSEKLIRRIKRTSTVFERKNNKIVSAIKSFSDLKKIKLRRNASVISSAFQYELKSIDSIYKFFESIVLNVSWAGKVDLAGPYNDISRYYKDNPEVFKTAIQIIKECDLGVSDIKIQSLKKEDGSDHYFPVFTHDAEVDSNWLLFHSQSLGTQTLFRSIPYYIFALTSGGILVMDEFDTDFHPHMLPKIVSYFDDDKFNKQNAQMIFSTHNTDILEYLGKYRTVLINKDSGESYGYRLDELQGDIIRNDRPLAPVYNSGKIGGVPRI